MTVNGLWFTNVEDRFGIEVAVEPDLHMWRVRAGVETKRLLEIFGKGEKSPRDVLKLIDVMNFSNIFTFEMESVDSEEARLKQGRGEYPCKEVGIACYEAPIKMISPEIELKCIF